MSLARAAILSLGLVAGFAWPTLAQDAVDQATKAYMTSLFSVPGRVQEEFARLAGVSPLLMSYSLTLFGAQRCKTPPASEALIAAAGSDSALETEAGKKVFIVAGVIATMSYPTEAQVASMCSNINAVVAEAERLVAKP